MRILILFLLFSFANAQTYLTENFNDFVTIAIGDERAMYVLNPNWHTVYNGAGSILTDLSGNSNTLAPIASWPWGNVIDGTDYLYNSGNCLIFPGKKDSCLQASDAASISFLDSICIDMMFVNRSASTNGIVVGKFYDGSKRSYATGINGNTNMLFQLGDATGGTQSSTATDAITISQNTPYFVTVAWNTTWGEIRYWVNQIPADTVGSGLSAKCYDNNEELKIGGYYSALASYSFDGEIAFARVRKAIPTANEIRTNGFLAYGWAAIDSNVTRNSFAFSQGVISDTVYYNTALTAGNWQVQVDVDGNSGGETYRILTSADKSTWSNIGSGTAPASSTTKIFTGRGLGYIGLAVSSATDTVFFDNLTVSVPSANAEFKQNSGWNKFKGW